MQVLSNFVGPSRPKQPKETIKPKQNTHLRLATKGNHQTKTEHTSQVSILMDGKGIQFVEKTNVENQTKIKTFLALCDWSLPIEEMHIKEVKQPPKKQILPIFYQKEKRI